jgi:heptaprenyl diphosphate synthase
MEVPTWLSCREAMSLLRRLDKELASAVETNDPDLKLMAGQAIAVGGKRIRPALLFLTASHGHASDEALLQCGAALELIHTASLYHDDVMDQATKRRHVPSANARWGNACAALTGIYLFARAATLLAGLGDAVNRLAAHACAELCSGQLLEVDNAYDTALPEARRLEILRRKTATLFELPCQLGALLGGCAAEQSKALAAYGRDIGLAFQLADDALDFAGDPAATGKSLAIDLQQGIYSIPVARALRYKNAIAVELRELLAHARLDETDTARAVELIKSSGSIQDVHRLARARASQAKRRLARLPRTAARASLEALSDFVVARSH